MCSVDVILPTFNSGRTLVSAVHSILQQSFQDFRLIIVDDGSTDSTPEILRNLATADPRIVVITTENRGIVEALNTGLGHCRADLVARQDADDLSYPERLATQVRYLEDHPDCIAVSGNALHIDENGRRIGATHWWGDAVGHPEAIPAVEPHLLHPFLMARAECVRAAGGYRHVLHAEDADLYWRMEPLGRLHVLEERLGSYRIHSGSVTSRSLGDVRAGALFSQLAALSAKRRCSGRRELAFSRAFELRVSKAASLAEMVAIAEEGLEADEREYLEVRTAAIMLQARIFRKFHFAYSDLRTIAAYLWRHRARIGRRERHVLLQAPFYYYYKPRAHLAALLGFLRMPIGGFHGGALQ
jgi:glycosyltransferase involved in cell wall biosynthesis